MNDFHFSLTVHFLLSIPYDACVCLQNQRAFHEQDETLVVSGEMFANQDEAKAFERYLRNNKCTDAKRARRHWMRKRDGDVSKNDEEDNADDVEDESLKSPKVNSVESDGEEKEDGGEVANQDDTDVGDQKDDDESCQRSKKKSRTDNGASNEGSGGEASDVNVSRLKNDTQNTVESNENDEISSSVSERNKALEQGNQKRKRGERGRRGSDDRSSGSDDESPNNDRKRSKGGGEGGGGEGGGGGGGGGGGEGEEEEQEEEEEEEEEQEQEQEQEQEEEEDESVSKFPTLIRQVQARKNRGSETGHGPYRAVASIAWMAHERAHYSKNYQHCLNGRVNMKTPEAAVETGIGMELMNNDTSNKKITGEEMIVSLELAILPQTQLGKLYIDAGYREKELITSVALRKSGSDLSLPELGRELWVLAPITPDMLKYHAYLQAGDIASAKALPQGPGLRHGSNPPFDFELDLDQSAVDIWSTCAAETDFSDPKELLKHDEYHDIISQDEKNELLATEGGTQRLLTTAIRRIKYNSRKLFNEYVCKRHNVDPNQNSVKVVVSRIFRRNKKYSGSGGSHSYHP